MSALYAGGWAGMGVIEDLHAGVTDRFLVSPIWRGALIAGRLLQLAVVIVIQTAILAVLGGLLGAAFPGGLAGIVAMAGAAILLGCAVGALSSGLALVVRQEESIIGASQFVILPMTFLSSLFMAQLLLPDWMQTVAGFNPANWAADAARGALDAAPDWSFVLLRVGWLLALTLACAWLASRAFRSYQRSVQPPNGSGTSGRPRQASTSRRVRAGGGPPAPCRPGGHRSTRQSRPVRRRGPGRRASARPRSGGR